MSKRHVIKNYLLGKEVTVPLIVGYLYGIIEDVTVDKGKVMISIKFKDSISTMPLCTEFKNYYVTEFLKSPSGEIETYLQNGDIALAQIDDNDKYIVVAVYKRDKNKVLEYKFKKENQYETNNNNV